MKLNIPGSGEAQFEGLIAKSATVTIRGSGNAKMTAQVDADGSISGNGNVELSGHPAMRQRSRVTAALCKSLEPRGRGGGKGARLLKRNFASIAVAPIFS
ncbi:MULTISPECIES: GIN domain-containing protein [unclassified Rhizobium]|uniref:GIN domain-containing protein n=1 Tax=unclassified Rhizobium TaxID=2613769 RepID=UPI0028AB302B|nr:MULTISPECIES: DUF2807 domain-containing protein [unclassified Rhizobium]